MNPVHARMQAALELRALTVAMRRQVLIRQFPEASVEQIDELLHQWLAEAGEHSEAREPSARRDQP